jgi:N-acetylmuramoyl-L-alanine amidase
MTPCNPTIWKRGRPKGSRSVSVIASRAFRSLYRAPAPRCPPASLAPHRSGRHAGFTPTPHHAEPIPGENRPFADRINGVYYFDHLVVLKTATQPALLLEAGIIVNRTDELILQQPAVREKIAVAIAAGLGTCLRAQPAPAFPTGEAP